jgi:hypothetical protein
VTATAGLPPPDVFQPEIPGLEPDTPREATGAPPKKKKKKEKTPWTLEFDDVRLADVRQIWIEDNRIRSAGTVEARLRVETKGGPVAIERARIDFRDVHINVLGFDVANGLELAIEGSMDPFRGGEYKGLEILKVVSASIDLAGRTTSVGLINLLLSKVTGVSVESRGGEVDGRIEIDHGVLGEGTRFRIDVPEGQVHIVDWHAQGEIAIENAVDSGGEGRETRVHVSLAEVEMVGDEQETPFLEGASLELAARAGEVDLATGGPGIAEALQAVSLDMRDARVADISRFPLPAIGDFELTSGDITVESSAAISHQGGSSRLTVSGQGIGARWQDTSMLGDLAIELDVVATDGGFRNFEFNESFVRIENVKLESPDAAEEDWSLRIEFEEGVADISEAGTLSTRVDLTMTDTRPLVAVVAREKETLSKLKGLLDFRDVVGQARIRLGNEIVQLEDVDLRSEGLQIEAQLRLGQQKPTGILWTKFHGIPLSADLRGEKVKLHVIGPRKWYDAQTDPWTAPPPKGDG